MSSNWKLTRQAVLISGASAFLTLHPGNIWAQARDSIEPFTYRASDDVLPDLKRRLAQTRWPDPETGTGWEQGVPLAMLQKAIQYRRAGYDWRECEAMLAGWPQFKTQIDGLGIHFIHVRSPHEHALPMLLSHGWPNTALLVRDVIGQGPASVSQWLLGPAIECRGSRLIPVALVLLEVQDEKISSVTSYLDTKTLFPRFGLPMQWSVPLDDTSRASATREFAHPTPSTHLS